MGYYDSSEQRDSNPKPPGWGRKFKRSKYLQQKSYNQAKKPETCINLLKPLSFG